MLLAVDVGNTQITLGVFRGSSLIHTWRARTDRRATSDELGVKLVGFMRASGVNPHELTGVIIASVVPALDGPLRTASKAYLEKEPLFVTSKIKLGIKNRYKNPDEVGADRLVNAVAIRALTHKPAIVVDFGTATTLDCVSAKGEYLGGAICPGLELAAEWLATHTAKLPRVTFQEAPPHALGRTTKESLQSGLFWGYISLVEGLLQRLTIEIQGRPMVVATGGLSPMIGPHVKAVSRILPNLTLEGLRLIWENNNGKRGT